MKNLIPLILAVAFMLAITSCNKNKPVKADNIEKSMLGDWDKVSNNTPDGVYDYRFLEDGAGYAYVPANSNFNPTSDFKIKYTITEDGTKFQKHYWNYYQDDWGTNPGSIVPISMPHKDTLVIDQLTYSRL